MFSGAMSFKSALVRRAQPVLLNLALLALLAIPGMVHARTVVLFDQGHGQKFLMERGGDLDLSLLAKTFRDLGHEVTTVGAPLNDVLLHDVDVLVISGPFSPYTGDEVEAVARFVQRGGALCVTLHIAPPVSALIYRLGVDHSNSVIHEEEGAIAGDSLNFRVTRMEEHPLFAGVDQFSLYGAWALRDARPGSRTIARTTPSAWVDLNRNNTFDATDARGSFGVVVAGEAGQGRFVVIGDDAVFQNRFLTGGNQTLARNLAVWLAGKPASAPAPQASASR